MDKNEIKKREKMVDDALSISLLDAGEPSEFAKKMTEDYISGKITHDELKKKVIESYRED